MLDGLTAGHLLVLAGVMLLLFGARRLPEAARALGRSVRILRSEGREFSRDATMSGMDADPPSEELHDRLR